MTERRYVLTKVWPGEYLLPSNDARTIWRLKNEDSGSDHGWAVYRWNGDVDLQAIAESIADYEWDRWETCEYGLATRRDAIDAALRPECEA